MIKIYITWQTEQISTLTKHFTFMKFSSCHQNTKNIKNKGGGGEVFVLQDENTELHQIICNFVMKLFLIIIYLTIFYSRRIHVDFSQSVSKYRWKGKGRLEVMDEKAPGYYEFYDLKIFENFVKLML